MKLRIKILVAGDRLAFTLFCVTPTGQLGDEKDATRE
jgi:hypothetical protein